MEISKEQQQLIRAQLIKMLQHPDTIIKSYEIELGTKEKELQPGDSFVSFEQTGEVTIHLQLHRRTHA